MTENSEVSTGQNDQELREEIDERVTGAIRLYNDGDKEAALEECKKIIEKEDIDAANAARVAKLFDALGQTTAASQIQDRILERLKQEAEARPESASMQREAGLLHGFFDEDDLAIGFFQKSLDLEPKDARPAFQISAILLKRGDPAGAIQAWEPVIANSKDSGRVLLIVARLLGQFGFREQAEDVIERARPLSASNMKEFEFVAAGVRGETKDLDQHGMAVELFDSFASSYDQTLAKLENNGPAMIGRMLLELGLPQENARSVLDAGCGTGLCANHLRPYAKTLAGADISAKMLNICLEKGVYDTLTRTDLSVPATYPEGSFDLVVAADVLVYFGNLEEVFRCIHAKLTPGGWFIFTVEKAPDPEPPAGYRLNASGRHVHTLDHINSALATSGFGIAKRHFEDTIRKELGQSVAGLSVAAQKPALAIFS